jgi:cytochrome P450
MPFEVDIPQEISVRNRPFFAAKAIVGPNEMEFLPKRFLNRNYFKEKVESDWISSPLLHFGTGPTVCEGMHYVKYVGGILLQELAVNYRLEDANGEIRLLAKENDGNLK